MELDAAFTAERQAFVQVPLRVRVAVIHDSDGRENVQRFRHVADEAGTSGPLQAELESAARTVGETYLAKRSNCNFLVTESFCELECASAELERLAGCGCGLSQMREVGVGQPELTPRRLVLEQYHGLARAGVGLDGATRTPEELRQEAECVAFIQAIAECTSALERFLQCCDPVVVLIRDIARFGLRLEELRSRAERQPGGDAKRARILGGRLAVGTQRSRTCSGLGRVAKDGLTVAGSLCVMCQHCGIVRPAE